MARPKGSSKPTAKNKLAVDLLISGNAKGKEDALRKAGYTEGSVTNASHIFKQVGVLNYLKSLDQASREKFGKSIQDKVMGTYFDALDATKLYGKEAIEHPDYRVRIESADRFTKFFGWELVEPTEEGKQFNQFNFFNVNPNKQRQFHENLKSFLKKSYSGGKPVDAK